MKSEQSAEIPMKSVGPVLMSGPVVEGEFSLPLATFETPLWPSVARGARITRMAGGLSAVVTGECMTRSVAVEADTAAQALTARQRLEDQFDELAETVSGTSRFCRLQHMHFQQAGHVLFIRLSVNSGDASGHNMVTKAADAVLTRILEENSTLRYVSISGNVCTDKKVSAVNGLLGRGRSVVADVVIPEEICRKRLRISASQLADLNYKKNWMGSSLAGSLRSANAHYANMLLAFYLATGQDAANIVEGSQGFTHAEARGGDLYFSVTLPHLIVGTVGNGKDLPFVKDNLERLGCRTDRAPGENARRLAVLAAAAVWCGELSLLAAQANPGELMKAHIAIERKASS